MYAIERASTTKSNADLKVVRMLRRAGADSAIKSNDEFNAKEVAKYLPTSNATSEKMVLSIEQLEWSARLIQPSNRSGKSNRSPEIWPHTD